MFSIRKSGSRIIVHVFVISGDKMINVMPDFQKPVHFLQCFFDDKNPVHEIDTAEKAKTVGQSSPSSEIPLRCR